MALGTSPFSDQTRPWNFDIIDEQVKVANLIWDDTTSTWIKQTAAASGSGLTDTQLRASAVPVSGTFFQATQPVSGTFFQATQPVSLATAPSTPVTNANLDVALSTRTKPDDLQNVTGTLTAVTSITNALPTGTNTLGVVSIGKFTRSDTFTGTGSGVTVDASGTPTKTYAIQVVGTGGTATAWDIRLEGSLDNTSFTQILQHTNVTGDGLVMFSGSLFSPSLYFRSRVAGLTLGGATNVVVTILGLQ